jgi:hypothetical protein
MREVIPTCTAGHGTLVVTAVILPRTTQRETWDCANKTGEKNDFSANVVIGRLASRGFLVFDVWKSKLNFAQLQDVVLQRCGLLIERYKTLPVLAIEDSAAGTQQVGNGTPAIASRRALPSAVAIASSTDGSTLVRLQDTACAAGINTVNQELANSSRRLLRVSYACRIGPL